MYPCTIIKVLTLLPLVISIAIADSNTACRDNERIALLRFKQGLTDPASRLSSWIGLDCCKWAGVRCNNRTGHVTQLRLRTPSTDDNYFNTFIGGEISSSLLNLTCLRYLDLSSNYFNGASIPGFIGSLSRLRYLNLSNSGFGGKIPHQLGNLTNLRYLDLHWLYISPTDSAAKLGWLSRLSSLQYLDLSNIVLEGSGVFDAITRLPALSVVIFSECGLNTIPHSLPLVNFSHLSTIDLSRNNLSSMPNWLFGIERLESIDLSSNSLSGTISSFGNLTSLQSIDLSYNNLSGTISSFGNLTSLQSIDLSANSLSGPISSLGNSSSLQSIDVSFNSLSGPISSLGNLSSLRVLELRGNNFNLTMPRTIGSLCNLQVIDLSSNGINADISEFQEGLSGCATNSLQVLDLGHNLLSGTLPDRLGMFRNLSELHLDSNIISGSIPESFGRLSSLRSLYLDNNKLEGPVPRSLGLLSELVDLDLSFNSLSGFISNAHLTNLTKLKSLLLSSNSIALNMSPNWVPPFQLRDIGLASCVLGPLFPSWLKTQREFQSINLSNGSIADSVPNWFWNLSSHVLYLDLSHNQISGSIPVTFTFDIVFIDLRSNQFHGPLPNIDDRVEYLYLSDNIFSGNLHPVLGNGSLSLSKLLLSDNLVNGTIPESICQIVSLEILDLSSNFLSGEIPNCSVVDDRSWSIVNMANNSMSGQIPQWIASLFDLQSLHLSNNNLEGKIPSLENCTSLYILDLGENKFKGNIPAWIGEKLSSLKMLRLRSNMFVGRIPHQFSLLNSLQILDLAENNLTGVLPRWLGNLTSMVSTKQVLFDFHHPLYSEPVLIQQYMDATDIYKESLSVALKGQELKYTNTLSLVVSLDLSGNGFSGEIPEELMKLVGLQSLNLSGNHLTGNIPGNFSYLRRLETLDLSRNQLSGPIPSSISTLTFLSHLNVSHNNLSGRIPTGNQLPTLDSSSYAGNADLCGFPSKNKCPDDKVLDVPVPDTKENVESEMLWMYIGGIVGFVVGFWSVWGPLILKKSWRISYCKFIDSIQDRLCKIKFN